MELSVKTLAGKAAGKIELDDAIFGIDEIRGDILQRTVRWQLARRQAGTHKAKSRSEVNRTTKKSIKQKGSGGARHGSRNAPIFVGGGAAHGPRVRSHAHDLPKKIRKMALAHALSSKFKDSAIMVIDKAEMDAGKTKDLVAAFKGLGIDDGAGIGFRQGRAGLGEGSPRGDQCGPGGGDLKHELAAAGLFHGVSLGVWNEASV